MDLVNISGTGLLVIDGNVDFEGSAFEWQGIVLVGGWANLEADTTRIEGALVTGMALQTGSSVPTNPWGGSGAHLEVTYNSCYVNNAFTALTGFATIPGGWMDNWASY